MAPISVNKMTHVKILYGAFFIHSVIGWSQK